MVKKNVITLTVPDYICGKKKKTLLHLRFLITFVVQKALLHLWFLITFVVKKRYYIYGS